MITRTISITRLLWKNVECGVFFDCIVLFNEPHATVSIALIADAAGRFECGVETAGLACMVGNVRSAQLYQKSGWRLAGTVVNQTETSNGRLPLEAWRYEKRLTRST
jgi:RimJ/RimL family protein N-acetyltransferase